MANVQTLVRAITYQNTDTDNPTTGARTVRATVNDGDGGTSANADVTVTVAGLKSGLLATKYESYFNDNFNYFPTAVEENDSRYSSPFTSVNHNSPNDYDNHYSVEWQGYFKASSTGTYRFYTNSDDSSWVWLGAEGQSVSGLIGTRSTSNEVVDNKGLHAMRETSGTIDLESGGIYPILIYFGEYGGWDKIILSFTPPGGSKTTDGSDSYFHIGSNGDTGNNTLTGTSSAESFIARHGNDIISGGGGDDVIRGGQGHDTLIGGGGSDRLTGGSGTDIIGYSATTDGGAVSSNQTASAAGVTGDTINGFVSGTDKFNFVSSAFGGLSTGALTNGTNFSIITEAYKGANAGTNSEFTAGDPTFILDSTDTLYYDPNGSSAGYTVVATMTGTNITAADVEIVSAL